MKENYKKEFKDLRRQAKKKGIKIRTGWRKQTWRGMNDKAAKPLKVACPKKTVLLSTSEDTYKEKVQTTRHELVERKKMSQGWHYPAAHRAANYKERTRTIKF